MNSDETLAPDEPADDEDERPVQVPMPENDDDTDEEDMPEELSFCELCGTSEDDDDELLRCEECGRLHCSTCREYDEDGTPYCTDCYDEIAAE